MDVAARLTALGMTGKEAERKAACFALLTRDLAKMSGASGEALAFWVPGRIEVLGKHTDYGGGRSLLCAIERGLCVLARPHDAGGSQGARLRARDAHSGETVDLDLSPDLAPLPGRWSNYLITVARRVAANFPGSMCGADLVFASDLPPAAGLSSSSALVVATFLVLSAVNDLPDRPEYRANIVTCEDLAGYLGAVENGLDFKALAGGGGVGTFGGSEDHTAILCGRANALVQYAFCPVRFERAVTVPEELRFVIAASGVRAEKMGAALERYNHVALRLGAGLDCWRRATGRADASMGAAVASAPDARTRIREVLAAASDAAYSAASLVARFEQFDVETNEIIPAAGDALAVGDQFTFGELVARSQLGAERGLENQIPETVALVRQARELGAVAASAFGAGFGGSVWALVDAARARTFRRRWAEVYANAFPASAQHADFFSSRAGPVAVRL